MEITKEQWDQLVNQVNGFQTKIEELTNQNAALKTANEQKQAEYETKQAEYETKLNEWQTKLNDQQRTLDTLAAAKNENKAGAQPKAAHKTVRFDPVKEEYVFDE